MTAGAPKTKNDEAREQVNALVQCTNHFLPHDDLTIRRLMRLCEQLMNADPAAAHSHIAALMQLTGDREKTLHHIDNAISLAPGRPVLIDNKCTNLSNLGYFSEAQECFAIAAEPERGHMTKSWAGGYIIGAFQTMRQYLEKAKIMQLELTGLDVDTAARAAAVLDRVKATDADVAKVLDVLGGVVREKKLFFAGPAPQVIVMDEIGYDPFIEMIYDFDVSAADAHALYVEFVDRLLERFPTAPQVLTISCRSWEKRERSAA